MQGVPTPYQEAPQREVLGRIREEQVDALDLSVQMQQQETEITALVEAHDLRQITIEAVEGIKPIAVLLQGQIITEIPQHQEVQGVTVPLREPHLEVIVTVDLLAEIQATEALVTVQEVQVTEALVAAVQEAAEALEVLEEVLEVQEVSEALDALAAGHPEEGLQAEEVAEDVTKPK